MECDFSEMRNEGETKGLWVLSVVDSSTGMGNSTGVETKAATYEHSIAWLSKFIDGQGHAKVRFRCDAEDTVKAIVNKAITRCKTTVLLEVAPRKSHASMGLIGQYQQMVQGQVRALSE